MEFAKQTSTVLHDEHMRVQAVLDRFAQFLREQGTEGPPASDDGQLGRIARDVRTVIETELPGHFAFEEDELFPRLAELGDGTMGELLSEEHETVQPVAEALSALCSTAIGGALDSAGWSEFRRLGADFVETMTAHIQKEEIGLIAAVEAMLDEDVDREIAFAYMAAR